jgi:putative FmdB family regulatory protein
MPTYDYHCQACDHTVEIFHGINEEPRTKCPECGKKKLKRLMGTGAAVMFKGSGFYQTDYRSDSYKKRASEDSKPSESKPSESKSSESKSSESGNSSSTSNGSSSGKSESKKAKAD